MNQDIIANLTLISKEADKNKKYILSSQEITLIGRASNCQIVLNPDEFITVSRYHAQIELVEINGEFLWQITNKSTTNGTLINGEKITEPYQLRSNDRIMLGLKGAEFIFETEILNATVLVENEPETLEEIQPKIEEEKIKTPTVSPTKSSEEEKAKNIKEETKTKVQSSVKEKDKKTESSKEKTAKSAENKPDELSEKLETKIIINPVANITISTEKTIWNLVNPQELANIDIETKDVQNIAFSADNQTISIIRKAKEIILCKWQTNGEIITMTDAKVQMNISTFSHDGKILASSGNDKSIYLWNIETQEKITTLSGHKLAINTLQFSPDNKILASSGADKLIKLWNVETQEEIATLSGHKLAINSLGFSNDGKYLISGGGDKVIKLWNMETQAEEKTIKTDSKSAIQYLGFNGDKKLILCTFQDNKVSLFDENSEKELFNFYFPETFGKLITVNSQGNLLASILDETKIFISQI
ncbi:FHA domain-containing protein [Geminocystis herdmanii]|uniref:FHA domain-containing protein n=1 Tax=Geminocystis herdmanii TaxID=669359 RepID=UPI00034C8CDB|nr:FHA domain-containing protein [Geminocystis herdmanii]